MPKDDDRPDDGRSRERANQDHLLEREARRESWLARLWRQRRGEKGRPHPGNRRADGPAEHDDRRRQ
jgi:hypothetical protein